jgi:ferredoxin
MKTIEVNDNCDGCGTCELHLPGLLRVLARGPLFINENNQHVNKEGINNAIKYCGAGALKLEPVN